MSNDEFKARLSVNVFKARTPADDYREIARIHNREAHKLLENSRAARAEGREHEAKLLKDLSMARRRRAEQFETAARGEGDDPIVTELLDIQQEMRDNFTPTEGQMLGVSEHLGSPHEGRFARALAWITRHQ